MVWKVKAKGERPIRPTRAFSGYFNMNHMTISQVINEDSIFYSFNIYIISRDLFGIYQSFMPCSQLKKQIKSNYIRLRINKVPNDGSYVWMNTLNTCLLLCKEPCCLSLYRKKTQEAKKSVMLVVVETRKCITSPRVFLLANKWTFHLFLITAWADKNTRR